jgi:hypothetical protein
MSESIKASADQLLSGLERDITLLSYEIDELSSGNQQERVCYCNLLHIETS